MFMYNNVPVFEPCPAEEINNKRGRESATSGDPQNLPDNAQDGGQNATEDSTNNKTKKGKKPKNAKKNAPGTPLDTSTYTVEERLVTAVWVHERKETYTSMSQIKANFRQRFGKDPPAKNTLVAWERKLFTTGSVHDSPRPGRPVNRLERLEEVVESVRAAPSLSMRARAKALRLPNSTLRDMLRRDVTTGPDDTPTIKRKPAPKKPRRPPKKKPPLAGALPPPPPPPAPVMPPAPPPPAPPPLHMQPPPTFLPYTHAHTHAHVQ